MCLEEMYHTYIQEGALFYISSHRRYPVLLTKELRQKVREKIQILQGIQEKGSVPAGEYGPKCKRCSIQDICMPSIRASAIGYCESLAAEAKGVEKR